MKYSNIVTTIIAVFAFYFLSFFLLQGSALAAQSTADVVADAALKEKLRQEIVGEVITPGGEEEYIIGYGDVLSISVYGEGDMAASMATASGREAGPEGAGGGDALRRSGTGVEVRLDGRMSLLHIGDVNIVGMTLTQLADYLKKLYETVYADPVLTVVLVQNNSWRYTVMGQVTTPGINYLDFPITIVQAIARSGGFTEWANHKVTVIRQGNDVKVVNKALKDEKKTLKFDYDDFLKGKKLEQNVHLQAGDVLIAH